MRYSYVPFQLAIGKGHIMAQKIILSSEELIVCPQCQHKFMLGDGITRQTIERYEQDFETVLKERVGWAPSGTGEGS